LKTAVLRTQSAILAFKKIFILSSFIIFKRKQIFLENFKEKKNVQKMFHVKHSKKHPNFQLFKKNCSFFS
jgi:hypothetical protein